MHDGHVLDGLHPWIPVDRRSEKRSADCTNRPSKQPGNSVQHAHPLRSVSVMIPVCFAPALSGAQRQRPQTLTDFRSSKARRPAAQRLCADCAACAPTLKTGGLRPSSCLCLQVLQAAMRCLLIRLGLGPPGELVSQGWTAAQCTPHASLALVDHRSARLRSVAVPPSILAARNLSPKSTMRETKSPNKAARLCQAMAR